MRKRFNRYERKENQRKELEKNMAGNGLYIFENASDKADLFLPRPTKAGVRKVGPKGRFQGDNYYFGMVKSNELRLIDILQTPEQEKTAILEQEKVILEQKEVKMEQKLILDQPNTVNQEGTVEHVIANKKQNQPKNKKKSITENKKEIDEPEVLINEDPSGSLEIIVD